MQAITRVNAEQTSKRARREPTYRTDGEGRRWSSHERHGSTGPAGVLAMACREGESTGNTGSPRGGTTVFPTGRPRGTGRAAEGWRTGSQYRGSRVMPVEGRDLTSGALWKRPTARGLTARSSNPNQRFGGRGRSCRGRRKVRCRVYLWVGL